MSARHPHGQAVRVHLDQAQPGDRHQPFGQQAQQQLPVERDAHGEQRVVEDRELVVAVTVDAVQRQLQHGAFSGLLGVLLALLEQVLVDGDELFAEVGRVKPIRDCQVRIV